MTVTGYMTFASMRQTLPVEGSASGNTAAVTLTGDCYAIPGRFSLTLQLSDGEVRHTLLHATGEIARTAEETLISSGKLLPSLPELLAQIAEMQSATEDARAAADAIQGAVDDAAQAASDASAAVSEAQEAVQSAEAAAHAIEGMTVSAANGDAAAAEITDQEGVKHIALTIPRGEPGISPTVTASKSGQTTTLTIADVNGTHQVLILDGKDGADGTTPVKGVDYYTSAEKAEMVNLVKAAMPVFTLTGTDEDGAQHTWTLYGVKA